jgi:AcrR family transcriptional regulator
MPPAQRREQLLDAGLSVILEQGYARVSIEAIARAAGVTRPVVYDHFRDLERLLHALVLREEAYAIDQLEQVVPEEPGELHLPELLALGMRRFLDAVLTRPATWRIILLPLDGTPELVREHVEMNRQRTDERIARLVGRALERPGLARCIDLELTAKTIRHFGEEAGRMALTDPERFSPERYERFVASLAQLAGPGY